MCLEIKENQKSLIAKKDITCYKLVVVNNDGNLTTLFQKTSVILGNNYNSSIERYYNTIEKGIHSFTKLKEAKEFLKIIKDETTRVRIVKCIIPKDSLYFNGMFNNYKSMASNQILYTKEIININFFIYFY